MSTDYEHGDTVPSDTLCNRLDELAEAITKGPEVIAREFSMRIPAELDRDADLVLTQASKRIRILEQCHGLNFAQLRTLNVQRCNRWHPKGINSWSASDWAVAMVGEAGEACNVIKKLNRCRDGLPGNTKTEQFLLAQLAHEIADTLLYLDLLAASQGINLATCVQEKFNIVSEVNGFPEKL